MCRKILKVFLIIMLILSTTGCSYKLSSLSQKDLKGTTTASEVKPQIANEYNINGQTIIGVNGFTPSTWTTCSDSCTEYSSLDEIKEKPEEVTSLRIDCMAIH